MQWQWKYNNKAKNTNLKYQFKNSTMTRFNQIIRAILIIIIIMPKAARGRKHSTFKAAKEDS